MDFEHIIPNEEEVHRWLLETLRHVFHVEFFLYRLGLGFRDPERPHDIVGIGNKFRWRVIRGLAIQYRDFSEEERRIVFKEQIEPALKLHRRQYHHRMWNYPDAKNIDLHIEVAEAEDMQVGAVDAICSLLENRVYQGGEHSYEEAEVILGNNPSYKKYWARMIGPKMKEIVQPDIERINSLYDIPNIGLPAWVYNRILGRVKVTLKILKKRHGYILSE